MKAYDYFLILSQINSYASATHPYHDIVRTDFLSDLAATVQYIYVIYTSTGSITREVGNDSGNPVFESLYQDII